MDPKLLPEALRPENMKQRLAHEYPITQVNPVTGYRTALYRDGTDADFLGWLQLLNGNEDAGYIYIRRPLRIPDLGSSGYVVMDFPPEFSGTLMSILQSGEPLQIRFEQATANADASAFLEHRE
jgi:hypothetical protein